MSFLKLRRANCFLLTTIWTLIALAIIFVRIEPDSCHLHAIEASFLLLGFFMDFAVCVIEFFTAWRFIQRLNEFFTAWKFCQGLKKEYCLKSLLRESLFRYLMYLITYGDCLVLINPMLDGSYFTILLVEMIVLRILAYWNMELKYLLIMLEILTELLRQLETVQKV